MFIFVFKQKTAYEMRISDWSSDVCTSDLGAEWGTSKAMLGALFSIGIIGMAGGCLVLGPLADSIGRRPMALASLTLLTASLAFSALATAMTQLLVWRFITGARFGALVSVAYPLSGEYVNGGAAGREKVGRYCY